MVCLVWLMNKPEFRKRIITINLFNPRIYKGESQLASQWNREFKHKLGRGSSRTHSGLNDEIFFLFGTQVINKKSSQSEEWKLLRWIE